MKKVVLVGHCGADSSYLRIAVSSAGAAGVSVISADDQEELDSAFATGDVELVLINRVLDWGFEAQEGVALVAKLHKKYPHVKTMLVSNYPDAQQAAVQAGALPGFGKRELSSPRVPELIRAALEAQPAAT